MAFHQINERRSRIARQKRETVIASVEADMRRKRETYTVWYDDGGIMRMLWSFVCPNGYDPAIISKNRKKAYEYFGYFDGDEPSFSIEIRRDAA